VQILHFIRRNDWREHGSKALNRHFVSAGGSAAAAEMTLFRRLARSLPPPCNLCIAAVVAIRLRWLSVAEWVASFPRKRFFPSPHYRTKVHRKASEFGSSFQTFDEEEIAILHQSFFKIISCTMQIDT
jgi:hypothetical protein